MVYTKKTDQIISLVADIKCRGADQISFVSGGLVDKIRGKGFLGISPLKGSLKGEIDQSISGLPVSDAVFDINDGMLNIGKVVQNDLAGRPADRGKEFRKGNIGLYEFAVGHIDLSNSIRITSYCTGDKKLLSMAFSGTAAGRKHRLRPKAP